MARIGNVLRSKPERAGAVVAAALALVALAGCTADGKAKPPDFNSSSAVGPTIEPECTGLVVTHLRGRTFDFRAVGQDYDLRGEDSLDHTTFTFGNGAHETANDGLTAPYTYPKAGTYKAHAEIVSDVAPDTGLQPRTGGSQVALGCPVVTVHVR